jgi:hypothetical protein
MEPFKPLIQVGWRKKIGEIKMPYNPFDEPWFRQMLDLQRKLDDLSQPYSAVQEQLRLVEDLKASMVYPHEDLWRPEFPDMLGIVNREVLTKNWTDWIDYWAVDFDFESNREIIRVKNEDSGEWEELWTGDFIFENEWQSFRTKKDRTLELTSVFHECAPGRRKIAVKVVDIFGNDTMTIVEVMV